MFEKVLLETRLFALIRNFLKLHPEYKAYVVGGYVRDMLLQQKNKDIDIVVVSPQKGADKIGIVFAKKLATFLGVDSVSYFENFGTAAFKFFDIPEDIEVEIVGARKESYDRGSRKPLVEDGTLDDDLSRRDFTFNAMAVSLNPEDFGTLIDKFNGMRDLQDGIIRTPLDPNITFSDDPLRMLRAIRFASRFQCQIEGHTYKAIKDNVDRLDIISPERIVQEMNKILLSKKPSYGLSKLQDTGLLKKFLPELSALDLDAKGHKNNFIHTIQVVDQTREVTNDIVVMWAALLHDIGKARTRKQTEHGWSFHDHENVGAKMVMSIFQRLKLPINEWSPKVVAITKLHGRLKVLTDANISTTEAACRRIAFEAGEFLDDLLLFVKCDITTKFEEKRIRFHKAYDLLQKRILEIAEKDNMRNFTVPITGEEIMSHYNLPPSKPVGQIKEDIKNAILDGVIPNDVEAAREYMYKIADKYLPSKVV